MNVALALVAAYLSGSIPTAIWVARAMGHDLRAEGSGNPGTANALGVAGPRAAAGVLFLDAAKGAAAVVLARALGGDAVGLAASVAVIAGQIVNVWLGFRGGKGLGVGLGATLALWPFGVAIMLPALGVAAKLAGSAAKGALIILGVNIGLTAIWGGAGLYNAWGIEPTWSLVVWSLAIAVLVAPKFIRDVRDDRAAPDTAG